MEEGAVPGGGGYEGSRELELRKSGNQEIRKLGNQEPREIGNFGTLEVYDSRRKLASEL